MLQVLWVVRAGPRVLRESAMTITGTSGSQDCQSVFTASAQVCALFTLSPEEPAKKFTIQ